MPSNDQRCDQNHHWYILLLGDDLAYADMHSQIKFTLRVWNKNSFTILKWLVNNEKKRYSYLIWIGGTDGVAFNDT